MLVTDVKITCQSAIGKVASPSYWHPTDFLACVRMGTPVTCTRSYVCRSYRRGFHTLNVTETLHIPCGTSEFAHGDVGAFNGVTWNHRKRPFGRSIDLSNLIHSPSCSLLIQSCVIPREDSESGSYSKDAVLGVGDESCIRDTCKATPQLSHPQRSWRAESLRSLLVRCHTSLLTR